jgi:hypothetical protein
MKNRQKHRQETKDSQNICFIYTPDSACNRPTLSSCHSFPQHHLEAQAHRHSHMMPLDMDLRLESLVLAPYFSVGGGGGTYDGLNLMLLCFT